MLFLLIIIIISVYFRIFLYYCLINLVKYSISVYFFLESMQLTSKEIRILQALHFLKEHSRYEIAHRTGISTVSVTTLLNRLIEDGRITKSGKTESRSGRPSVLYDISPDFGYFIGVSIETNSIRLVAIDSGQLILVDRERPLILSPDPGEHLADIIRQLGKELESLFASGLVERERMLAMGMSLPGMVDTERGVWLTGFRVSGIGHIHLRDILERKFSIPVSVEDPTRCISWRELTRKGADMKEPFVLLYLGSGVGAGIVIDGKLYRGAGGLAGEIGHLHVTEDGDRCPCGNIGCLETVVSEPSILRNFQRRLAEGVISTLGRILPENLDILAIYDAAKSGDRLARSTLYDLGLFLGETCATLVELYNPSTLLIGGSVGVLGEFFDDPINLRLRQRVLPEMLNDLELKYAPHEPNDEAIGAAKIAERRFWESLGKDLPLGEE